MFRYRLHLEDGSDAGEATYAQMIRPGEEIIAGNNESFRVVDFVPFGEEDESPFGRAATGRVGVAHAARRRRASGTRRRGGGDRRARWRNDGGSSRRA